MKENKRYNIFKDIVYLELKKPNGMFNSTDEYDSFDNFSLIDKVLTICLVYGIQFSKLMTFEDVEKRKSKSILLPSRTKFYNNFYSIFFSLFLREVMTTQYFNEIMNYKYGRS